MHDDISNLFPELLEETGDEVATKLLHHLEAACHPPLNYRHYEEADIIRFSVVLQKLPLSTKEYASIQNLMNFAIALEKVHKKFIKEAKEFLKKDCKEFMLYFTELHKILHEWLKSMISSYSRMSDQQCIEFRQELLRLKMLLKMCR